MDFDIHHYDHFVIMILILLQSGYDFEHSEFLLYQNMVIQESGAYDDALKHLQANKDQIYDKVTIQETFGNCFPIKHYVAKYHSV